MVTNSSVVQRQILVLTERNYDTWFIKMRTIYRAQDLLDFVMIGYLEPMDQDVDWLCQMLRIFLMK